jgi:hypothetical protein
VKTGQVVHCQNPRTLLIIVVGMSCMMVLVTFAMLLLCWFVVRQRRLDRRAQASIPDPQQRTGLAPPATAPATAPTASSPEYDDAVFVQLPGDEKPHFFALPKPFPINTCTDPPKPADGQPDDSQAGVGQAAAKVAGDAGDVGDADPCVQSSDGLYRNPLFVSQ